MEQENSAISDFTNRSTEILGVYNMVLSNLESLNQELEEYITANTSEINRIEEENKEISKLRLTLESTIKTINKSFNE